MNSNKIKTMPEIKPYKKMTAVEWLIQQIKDDQNQKALSAKEWFEVINQAKEMEKQQMKESFAEGYKSGITDYMDIQNGYDGRAIDFQQYYNEKYGSKGSDETLKENHIVDINEMICKHDVKQVTESDYVKYLEKKITSSQTEISDEEIENCVGDGMHYFYKGGFIEGAKWYREQLKKKQ